MRSEKFEFPGHSGESLAARLDLPIQLHAHMLFLPIALPAPRTSLQHHVLRVP